MKQDEPVTLAPPLETSAPTDAPSPGVEELEQEWAALSCDCTGDFL